MTNAMKNAGAQHAPAMAAREKRGPLGGCAALRSVGRTPVPTEASGGIVAVAPPTGLFAARHAQRMMSPSTTRHVRPAKNAHRKTAGCEAQGAGGNVGGPTISAPQRVMPQESQTMKASRNSKGKIIASNKASPRP